MSTTTSLLQGPWRLTLVTNPDDCNLGCSMCERGAGRPAHGEVSAHASPRRMGVALALRVVEEARLDGLREVIPSTLGEPLLWRGLDALVDLCAALGVALNVTTNGTFPVRGARAWAERIVPVASDVKISWNGATAATAESIMAGLDFEAAVENVLTFAAIRDERARAGRRRCRLSFQVTAQEGNLGEIPSIVRLGARLGVDRVKLNHLQIRFPSLAPLSLRRSAEAIGRWNAAVRAARRAAGEARRADGRTVELANAVELAPDPLAPAPRGPCPFLGREAWVLWDGRFAPCPHPGAARGELGDFGSAAERALRELWEGADYQSLSAGYEAHPVCRVCPFRRPGGA